MSKKSTMSRREFLSVSAMAGVVGAIGVSPLLAACGGGEGSKSSNTPLRPLDQIYIPQLTDKAIDGKPLRAGLIGCGGRGSGAAENFLTAADNVTVVALGDVLADQVKSTQNMLRERHNTVIEDSNCFVGFDAYKKVIDAGVDVVLIATPPFFRPEHFRYATEKGVHSFLEKPIAVDPAGYRVIMATAKQATAKGLSVITGTQRRHNRGYVESFRKIVAEGLIGEITGGAVYWNTSHLWFRNRKKEWSDMEWMIRDWVNWTWLSGDHIVEQHVHNIDVFTWFSGYKPVKATGFGSRHHRVTGDQFDNFSVDFECDNGVHFHSMCRQIDGCSNNVSEFIQGTTGSWSSNNGFTIRDLAGNEIWKYDSEAAKVEFQQHEDYVLEHVNWISTIRRGEQIMEAEQTAVPNMAAIMGRMSAYTGKSVTWDEAIVSTLDYTPPVIEMGPIDMSGFTVPVPGTSAKE